jgi:Asp-tRNA(Asn)/Glu-tRNA(Gln) amidotransferase A subunit family amidase
MPAHSPCLDAVSLQELVDTGSVSAQELVKQAPDRIAAYDTDRKLVALHAEANAADAPAPAERSVLHGIPVLVKDLADSDSTDVKIREGIAGTSAGARATRPSSTRSRTQPST